MRNETTERTEAPVVIYLLRNTVNGKCYVGKTEDFDRRMRQHSCGYGNCIALRHGIEKHTWEVFDAHILERTTRSAGSTTERRWIAALDCQAPHGYNLTDGGEGGRLSETTRQKLSATQTAKAARGELPQQYESPDKKATRNAKQSETHLAKVASGEHASLRADVQEKISETLKTKYAQGQMPQQKRTAAEKAASAKKGAETMKTIYARGEHGRQRFTEVEKANHADSLSVSHLRSYATRLYKDRTSAGQTYTLELPLVNVNRSHKRKKLQKRDYPDNGETQLELL